MTMLILLVIAAITLYAILITIRFEKKSEEAKKATRLLDMQTHVANKYREHSIKMYRRLLKQREEMNDEIHKLERENKRQLDVNAKLMGRLKRVMP